MAGNVAVGMGALPYQVWRAERRSGMPGRQAPLVDETLTIRLTPRVRRRYSIPPEWARPEASVITCPKCSKDNQDHYKFCLGCGAELPRGPAPKPFSPQTPPQGMKAASAAAAAPQPAAALGGTVAAPQAALGLGGTV